jgi:hypothetical protein
MTEYVAMALAFIIPPIMYISVMGWYKVNQKKKENKK